MLIASVGASIVSAAPTEGLGEAVFAYQQGTLSQTVTQVNTSGKSQFDFKVRARKSDWGNDPFAMSLKLYAQGTLVWETLHPASGLDYISSDTYSVYSLSVASSAVSAWNTIDTAVVTVTGGDSEFWAGNYGTRIDYISLELDGAQLLNNHTFLSGSTSWTSSVGWQQCSGGSGGAVCIANAVPTTNAPYTLGNDMVWAVANEGWDLSLTAPGGGAFTDVVFASYGNPDGFSGEFTQNWCHATNSISKVAEAFVGKTSATIASTNAVFGDPCGGTYKRLAVVLRYAGGTPPTTTLPPPPPSCGPYDSITVTGTRNGGSVWGSGPYTDDSDMAVAAVHAGIIEPGQTATLVATNVAYHSSYPGSTANGVTTSDWLSGWCGYDLVRYVVPTTTTTTTTTTTATTTMPIVATTTSTSSTSSTSTTEPPFATTPQTIPPQTTTSLPTTTTTQTPTTTTTTTTTTLPPTIKPPLPSSSSISAIGTAEKLAEVITTSNIKEITSSQAVALITNPVFTELSQDKLQTVFENVPITELTAEQETALVTTLSSAPAAVKETFEAAVDVYGSGLDEYVPEGSAIDVGTRRSVIAVTTVLSTATAAAAAAPTSQGGGNNNNGGGSPSRGDGPPSGDANQAARREDEEEEEEAGGLEGPEDREKNTNTRNSIYKYQENGMKKFNVWGFVKKFMKETAALSFTFAGSAIMFVTLSGDTRRIAIIATVAAVAVHYVSVMLANDEE